SSLMHSTHWCVLTSHCVALGQSALARQPIVQAVPAQYCPVGQLSLSGTHAPRATLHTCPDGHCGCDPEQPVAHCICRHTLPTPQSLSVVQPTHWRDE